MAKQIFKDLLDAHEKLDEERHSSQSSALLSFRKELCDEEQGWLPRLERQLMKSENKLSRFEKMSWVLTGIAVASSSRVLASVVAYAFGTH